LIDQIDLESRNCEILTFEAPPCGLHLPNLGWEPSVQKLVYGSGVISTNLVVILVVLSYFPKVLHLDSRIFGLHGLL